MNFKTDLLYNIEPRRYGLCFAEQDAVTDVDASGAAPAPIVEGEPELEIEEAAPLTAVEEAELDIGPDKIKVDKRVKEAWDGLQKSAQETRETVNKRMTELATQEGQIQERARIFQSVQAQMIEIGSIDQQIAPYQKLTPQDWIAWGQQDADAANKAMQAVSALNLRRQQLAGQVETTVKDVQSKEAQAATMRAQAADLAISTAFKDWSPQKREQLVSTAVQYGFQPAELGEAFRDPRALSIVQDAMKYRAAVAKAAAKAVGKPTTTAEQIAAAPAPGTKVNGNAGNKANDLSDRVTDPSEWARNFSKALKQRKR